MIANAAQNSGFRAVCIREIQKSLRESAKRLLEDKIRVHGVADKFEILNDHIKTPGGGIIIFQGMQDHTAESIKSLEGFHVAWAEEAQTMTSRSLELLRPTIRAPGSELWFSWNPRLSSDPVDKLLRQSGDIDNAIIVESNWRDNPYFPAELEAERVFDKKHRPDRYGHIWEGEYEPQAVGAIWTMRDIEESRVDEAPREMKRIVVAVDPATSSKEDADYHGIVACGVAEDGHGYVLEDSSTKGTPEKWGRRAIALYDYYQADAIVIEKNQGGEMCKTVIDSIRPGVPVVLVHASRGKHVRAEPISALYALGRVHHVKHMPQLEAQMVQMTAEGFEGEGSPDRCLIEGTLIETLDGPVSIETVAVGDNVLTRNGYRRVIASEMTSKSAEVFEVSFSDGKSITATSNHPVWTDKFGFIKVSDVCYGLGVSILEDNPAWRMRQKKSTESSLLDTRKVQANHLDGISMKGLEAAGHCIDTCGKRFLAAFQTGFTSITEMAIRSIMTLPTLSVFPRQITPKSMRNHNQKHSLNGAESTLAQSVLSLLPLTSTLPLANAQMLQGQAGNVLNTGHQLALSAAFDMKHAPQKKAERVQGGALTERMNTSERWTRGIAKFAALFMKQGLVQKVQKPAPVSVVQVSEKGRAKTYNIAVEGENEYYANGVLVHNCDALVWGMTELFPEIKGRQHDIYRPALAQMDYDLSNYETSGGRQSVAEMD